MSNKKKKEFKKVSLLLKTLLKKMYKRYGYDDSIQLIKNMNNPSQAEKDLMFEYLIKLNETNNPSYSDKEM